VVGEGSANPKILKSVKHIIYRLFHSFADYVAANSYANMKIIRKINPFLSDSACKIIYNLIDFEKWKPLDNYIPRSDGVLKMIVVASHGSVKNLSGLADALSLMTREEQNKLRIHWYGDKITEPYFNDSFPKGLRKIKDLKLEHIITFYPATGQILQKIQEADVMGLFSIYEGFPNVVCEAMACRKPILCTAVSDLANILSHESHLLCDPANPETIKQAICNLISLSNDELVSIGRKNEELAKVLFDKNKNVSQYLQLFSR
jgi:glycosyltransferase involved in cell wall biosynthesis